MPTFAESSAPVDTEHHAHPERGDITVAEALDMERPALQPILAPFDGFHAVSYTHLTLPTTERV